MAGEAALENVNQERSRLWRGVYAVSGIMTTLVIYGVSQEKIMRVPYGTEQEYFKYSLSFSATGSHHLLFLLRFYSRVRRLWTQLLLSISMVSIDIKHFDDDVSALKYVSFPVQTLAKCAKMIPVMIWGTVIMQKNYKGQDYLIAFLVTVGCSIFILYPAGSGISPSTRGRENIIWGILLMVGYLGFDGFTSTFEDKLFKDYDMEIHNQIFYTTVCSCILSFIGLVLQGHLLRAIDIVYRHHDCFFKQLVSEHIARVCHINLYLLMTARGPKRAKKKWKD